MTTTAPDKTKTQKPLNPDTRLARMMLPEIDPHSALLPTNKWIIQTLRDMVKTHSGIRGCLKRAGLWALGGVAALGAGIAGAVLAPGLAVAGGIGALSVLAAGAGGFFARREIMKIKTDYMGDVQEIVKNKYLEMKANELKRAWREKAAQAKLAREARAQEAAQKAAAAKAAAEAAEAEKKKAAAEAALKPAETKPADAPQGAAPAEKNPSKPSMLKTFGRWAAQKAKEGAHALEDKIHDALEDKPAQKPEQEPGRGGNDNNGAAAPDAPKKSAAGPKNG